MLQKEVAGKLGIPPSTLSRWWNNGATRDSALRAANLLTLLWARETKGSSVNTHVCPSDVVTPTGFREQLRKIYPAVNDGRGRGKCLKK